MLACRVRRVGPVFVTKVDRCALVRGLLRGHAPFRLHLDREFKVVALWLVLEDARRDVLVIIVFLLAAGCLSTSISVYSE